MSDHVAGDGAPPQSAAAEAGPLALLYQVALSSTPEHIFRGLENIGRLSDRESAVFERLGLGCNNRGIAQQLTLSERTVKRHVSAALRKLGVESRLQAGLVAQLARLLQYASKGDYPLQPPPLLQHDSKGDSPLQPPPPFPIKAPSDPKVVFTDSGVTDDTVAEASPPSATGNPAPKRPGNPPD